MAVTHHMSTISFSAEQEQSKGDFVLDDAFSSRYDELYSLGDTNITFKTYSDITQSLRLRSVGIMTAGLLQRTANNKIYDVFSTPEATPHW
jgi:hypothetical protein